MWKTYRIGKFGSGDIRGFYAPDLDTAFGFARAEWPSAGTLICHGSDADDDMAALGTALNEAYVLARRLKGRGVVMARLGLDPIDIKRMRDAAEDAYTLGKGRIA